MFHQIWSFQLAFSLDSSINWHFPSLDWNNGFWTLTMNAMDLLNKIGKEYSPYSATFSSILPLYSMPVLWAIFCKSNYFVILFLIIFYFNFRDRKLSPLRIFYLFGFSALCYIVERILEAESPCFGGLGLIASRRLANLPYCFAMVSQFFFFLIYSELFLKLRNL